jgi:glycosyltransferase involved in cell wall biosynthesis
LYAKKHGIKFVLFNHITPLKTDPEKDNTESGEKKNNKLLELAESADIIFSVGPRIFEYFTSEYKSKIIKIHRMYIPSLSPFFSNCRIDTTGKGECRVLCFGRTEDEKVKGIDIIAAAMGKIVASVTNPILVIRGVPHDKAEDIRQRLMALSKAKRLQIRCLPFASQQDVKDDILKSSLCVMPSRSEPFGLAALEAIAVGVPVLISSTSGLAKYIRNVFPFASYFIVDTPHHVTEDMDADAELWSKRINEVLRDPHRFQAVNVLRDHLGKEDTKNDSVAQFLKLVTQ